MMTVDCHVSQVLFPFKNFRHFNFAANNVFALAFLDEKILHSSLSVAAYHFCYRREAKSHLIAATEHHRRCLSLINEALSTASSGISDGTILSIVHMANAEVSDESSDSL